MRNNQVMSLVFITFLKKYYTTYFLVMAVFTNWLTQLLKILTASSWEPVEASCTSMSVSIQTHPFSNKWGDHGVEI